MMLVEGPHSVTCPKWDAMVLVERPPSVTCSRWDAMMLVEEPHSESYCSGLLNSTGWGDDSMGTVFTAQA